jgi:putative transposase
VQNLTAWQATAKTEAPHPTRDLMRRPASRPRPTPEPLSTDLPDGTVVKKLTSNGVFILNKVQYMVDGRRGFQQVLVITDGDKITVTDLEGEILIEHTRPGPRSDVRRQRPPRRPTPRPLKRHRCPDTSSVTDVLRHHTSLRHRSGKSLQAGDRGIACPRQ